jgi:hypothetical protein
MRSLLGAANTPILRCVTCGCYRALEAFEYDKRQLAWIKRSNERYLRKDQ